MLNSLRRALGGWTGSHEGEMHTNHDQLDAILNEDEAAAPSQGGQETTDEAAQRLYGAQDRKSSPRGNQNQLAQRVRVPRAVAAAAASAPLRTPSSCWAQL